MVRYKAADGKWKRAAAVRGRNGRIKPGFAMIDGSPAKVETFLYQVRYYDDRSVKYERAGTDAGKAETMRRRREKQSTAAAGAEKAGLTVIKPEGRRTLAASAQAYIADTEGRGAMEAALQARSVCEEFRGVVKRTFVDEVTRADILKFHDALKKRNCTSRTVFNKDARLRSWLRFAGVDKTLFPPKPKYEKALPTIYTSDQISSVLGAADSCLSLAINLALKCGLRDQELTYLEWDDIDEADKVLRVRGKERYGFKVKDSEQRELPIPNDLLDSLKAWKKQHPATRLVLTNGHGNPHQHLLRALKRLAKREKLNCGKCDGCKGQLGECQEWTLHKFRRTYSTTLLRSGVDLRTVQALMGHADLESTLRYLRPATNDSLQDKLNGIKW